jgi:polysaccharide chain length determinant protein (PEP-CTERM system associated)
MDQLLDQLFQYLHGIWLRRFWGLAVAWLIAVIGIPIALLLPAQYEATARVFVDTESVLKPLMAGLAVQPNTEQQVKILADTLLSRPNVEKLVLLADLDHRVVTEQDRNALVEKVTRGVKLTGPTRDNLFSLSYRDTEPARAKRIVDSILSLFVESGLSNKRHDTQKALAFLDAQIKEYEAVLSQAEERLKQFKLRNLDRLTSGQDLVGNMLALDTDIEKARTELRAGEQRRDALRKQLSGEDPVFVSERADRATGSTAVGADPLADLDSRADALRRNLDELLRKYTDEHPDVIGTRRILADLAKQRNAMLEEIKRGGPSTSSNPRREPNLVYQQIKVALAESEGNVAALAAKLSQLEGRYSRMHTAAKLRPEFEAELAQLNRDYQIQKTNFEQLVQRREQARMTGQMGERGAVDFRVIDPPRVAPKPVAPDRLLLTAAVLMLSLGAGVAVSFVVSQAFPTVSTVRDLRAVAQVSVLGSVSYRPTPAVLRRRTRNGYAFAAGVTGLCALFSVALVVLLVTAKAG